MTEFCTISNTIKRTIPYPDGVEPYNHSVCKYHEDQIILVDGVNRILYLFDPSPSTTDDRAEKCISGYLRRELSSTLCMSIPSSLITLCLSFGGIPSVHYRELSRTPNIGKHCSSISVGEEIHIFHGYRNSQHLVYSMDTDSFKGFKDGTTLDPMSKVPLLRWRDTLIRFGGWNWNNRERVDSFFQSEPLSMNGTVRSLQWIKKEEYKLKQPLNGCGYVVEYG